MCQTLNILNVDVYLYHEKPLNLRGEMGNGPLRDRTRMGQGLRLPYGRRITILTLVGLDRDLETVFPAFVVITKIVPPPAGMVPVHAEGASLGAPDSPPNGIPNPLRSSGIKLDSACNGMAFIQTRASTKYRCDNCRNRIITFPDDIP